MFSLYTRSSWSAPGWMDGDTFGLASHFLFVVIFFQQQLPRLLLPTTRSTGWQPAPATSVAHGHFPSFAIYRISCSPTGNPAPALSYRPIRRRCHASFYSGAIRDSDQSLMRSLESINRNLSVVVGRFPQWHWKNSRVAIKFDRFEFLENDTRGSSVLYRASVIPSSAYLSFHLN